MCKRGLLAAALLLILAVVAGNTHCDTHSRYCTVMVPGTRSEVGFTWDTWQLYVSTYQAGR